MTPARVSDPRAFVLANTRLQSPPHVPEIRLHLADEAMDLWRLTEEDLATLGLPLPFWAFAWAGGQALARYVLDSPATVAGRRVLVFAAGAGLEAIAAARAGAASIVATEIDPFALAALALNAEENGVAFTISDRDVLARPFVDLAPRPETVLLGDVFFEEPMATRVAAFAADATAHGADVLIGDPGRAYLPTDRLERLAEYQVPTTRALEDSEVKRTRVWRFRA
ncbi:class I SAM-dependent methyltransferase [Siculibacillus lacustris]|uniref:class I SAM-dependent methyltransferase n=1 Tax=Siculibacillus lacustris TaxID=1549641 RepID=UPI001D198287|nr:50S ribosomal protein L11 methyltransferase [Siculibacillus lacustris]